MTSRFTRFALLVLGLCGARLASAQTTYTPVTVTGFTDDIVANGAGTASSSTTNPADQGVAGNRFAYIAPNFVSPTSGAPTRSLPANGVISSVMTPGLTFQLGAYTGNNSLRLAGSSSGSLTLAAPQSTQSVWVAGASGNGQTLGTPVNMTVFFTDGTSQAFVNSVPDWFGGTGFAVQNLGRVNVDTDVYDNTVGEPRIYQFQLQLLPSNYGKLVQRIQFAKTQPAGAAILNIFNAMAVTLSSNCTLPTGSITLATTTVCPGTAVPLTVQSTGNPGSGYIGQWQSSLNGVTWTDITGATTTTYTATPQVTTNYRFRGSCGTTQVFLGPVTINVVVPSATVAYNAPYFCPVGQTASPAALPLGGVFSAPTGLALNAATGIIDLASSTAGAYTVTYTVTSPCPVTATTQVIVGLPAPTFSYACPPFYKNGPRATPVLTAAAGGTFTAPAGLAINANTGAVDLTASTVGRYTITYTTGPGCTSTAGFEVVDALVFPNIITPNGDKVNDELKPNLPNVTGYRLQVFSRWGRKVYDGTDANAGWTAADSGPGMYYYQLEYTDCTGGRKSIKNWVEVVK
ncbi:gliding motility-associated C-terminal domain-containing protein [Hymenobacter negativus]|uniref:Gliding motility-associated C-terminal domain-containing protein n=1 Tax=Hymenobacter negativus TaxID=2795026 RepID=A0ABS3QF33_9BACT|nr:gliding motility-associated C-terminal domain-containing protein [Hymenobacter negativus]MBO2009859.1 gliding motility-associated C-terminal domain-containing protein [Hymenobacter negativus]